ncbi:hypothetical protein [Virgibacillus halodenitrificans]|uniref:hypothetical protein n=1 Tax=Virgibacillus halodenitrificans TaxID=1482 RepID=UPI00045C9AEF|nr:hypothetical protein [Virgibacillus halodenitrificans]CDQ37708.1 hypothetical protein BN993_07270 [Virgibacillus halodenitrificans]
MYRISFTDIDRSLLKANKALKSKKGHSLLEAETNLNAAKKSLIDTVTLTIVLTDVEKGLDYIFDNVKVYDVSPGLMQILESEITTSGHEDAHRLINDIEKSYQEEINSQNSRVSKRSKGIRLFNSKKGKNGDSEKNNITEEDDFKEIEQVGRSEEGDFEEIKSLSEFSEIENEDIQDLPDQELEKTDYQFVDLSQHDEENVPEEQTYLPHFEEEDEEQVNHYVNNNFPEEESVEIEEDFVMEEESDSDNSENNKDLKHERVVFPAYNNYLDLTGVDSTISRFTERFEKDHLVKFLGLSALSSDAVLTDLDAVKLNFAINALDESEFILLKDYFHNSIENIKDKTQTQLTQVYEKAMMFDYEEEANQTLQEEFSSILKKSENTLSDYENQQEQEYSLKLDKFEHEQEIALEEFKRKQALERSLYVQDLDNKKANRISVFKDDLQNNLTQKKEDMVDSKMFELKYQSINELTETKRLAIRNFENQLDNAMDDVWDKLQESLKKLKEDIQERIPAWKDEIKEKHKSEAAKREEARKERELELERERIELQRRQLEKGDQDEKKEKETITDFERKMEAYTDKITNIVTQSQVSQHPMMYSIPQISQQDNKSQNNSNKIIAIGVTAALLIGGGTIVGKSLVAADVEPAKAQSQIQYEELASSISSLEDKFNLNEVSVPKENEKSLEDLINEKNYGQALKKFNDKDSLNAIETAIFNDKDLKALTSFNETNKSIFGELDAAILSGDSKKVVGIYNELTEDEQKALTDDRKEKIAFLLYQSGETEVAEKIAGESKEEKTSK